MKNIKKYRYRHLLLWLTLFTLGCSKPAPEEYFGIAVLNTNLLFGFADDGFSRQLESPSSKLSGNNGETVPMKRKEVINTKIHFIEEAYEKVKKLSETTDTKDMIESSLALYKFVLPVLRKDYWQLAELYDNNASKVQIESLTKSINEKYYSRFEVLYNNLLNAGKVYAEKNSIKVNWGVYGK